MLKSRASLSLLLTLTLLLSQLVLATNQQTPTSGQESYKSEKRYEKVIEYEPHTAEPVEIDNISVKNVRIEPGKKFSAKSMVEQAGGREGDWLEDLTFTITNKADKRITYLVISLCFPYEGTSTTTNYSQALGVDPRASGEAATYAKPFSLDAGQSYTFRLSSEDLSAVKRLVAMLWKGLDEVDRMVVRVPTIGYEDGVQWQLGKYSVPEKLRPSDKKVIERVAFDVEPYELKSVKVNGVELSSQERLVSNGFREVRTQCFDVALSKLTPRSEWLEGLEVVFKNKSERQAIYISLDLGFPETEVNGPRMVHSIGIGRHPNTNRDLSRLEEPLALEPGDEVVLRILDRSFVALRDFLALRKFRLSDLNRAVMKISTIVYQDGTRWSMGRYYRPDPDHPGKYLEVAPSSAKQSN